MEQAYVRDTRLMNAPRWPGRLWIARHGESAGNLARRQADAVGAPRLVLTGRDMDVPLSADGIEQAQALGRWFAKGDAVDRPDVILSSPYVRARQTAEHFRAAGGYLHDAPICFDERLREKEFGILDGLTHAGIASVLPEQAEFRRLLGKFYHRPPGGESWCDVILRLRSLLDTVGLHHGGRRVMIVAHQVVVLCLRYIIEGMTEEDILAIDATANVANASITEYRFDAEAGPDGGLKLVRYNAVAPLQQEDAPVTVEPAASDMAP